MPAISDFDLHLSTSLRLVVVVRGRVSWLYLAYPVLRTGVLLVPTGFPYI